MNFNISDKTKARIVKGNHWVSMLARSYQLNKASEAQREGNYEEAFYWLALVALGYLGIIAGDRWRRHFEDYYRVD